MQALNNAEQHNSFSNQLFREVISHCLPAGNKWKVLIYMECVSVFSLPSFSIWDLGILYKLVTVWQGAIYTETWKKEGKTDGSVMLKRAICWFSLGSLEKDHWKSKFFWLIIFILWWNTVILSWWECSLSIINRNGKGLQLTY